MLSVQQSCVVSFIRQVIAAGTRTRTYLEAMSSFVSVHGSWLLVAVCSWTVRLYRPGLNAVLSLTVHGQRETCCTGTCTWTLAICTCTYPSSIDTSPYVSRCIPRPVRFCFSAKWNLLVVARWNMKTVLCGMIFVNHLQCPHCILLENSYRTGRFLVVLFLCSRLRYCLLRLLSAVYSR